MPGTTVFDPTTVRKISFANITDGLSKTILLVERSGLPDHYYLDRIEPHRPPEYRTWGNVGLWAISAEMMLNHLKEEKGVPIVNADNLHGLYSFHPGGAQVAMSDGSLQFLREEVDVDTVYALVTREGGEIVDTDAIW